MVSVTLLTAPLALLPFDELEERDLGVLDLAVRERFEVEAARLRGLAADDAFGDRDLAGEDDRFAALALLPELAPRLLAGVGRALDERALEATMGPSFWVGVQALYPSAASAFSAVSGGAGHTPRAPTARRAGGRRFAARVAVLRRVRPAPAARAARGRRPTTSRLRRSRAFRNSLWRHPRGGPS
jgi:hypothetical protein